MRPLLNIIVFIPGKCYGGSCRACSDQLSVERYPLRQFRSQEIWFNENNSVAGKLFIYVLLTDVVTS